MGAMTGEDGFAAAGAAAGAAVGAATGGMYMYDQSRDDRRTEMLADSIGGAQKGETADDAGKQHLDDFLGYWKLDIWALDAQGKKSRPPVVQRVFWKVRRPPVSSTWT